MSRTGAVGAKYVDSADNTTQVVKPGDGRVQKVVEQILPGPPKHNARALQGRVVYEGASQIAAVRGRFF